MKNHVYKLVVVALTGILMLNQADGQSFTQVPQGISFQAVARDLQGNPARFRRVFIRGEIREGSASGNPVYVEVFETQTNAEGIFSIVIGRGVVSGANRSPFNRIAWDKAPHFFNLKISVLPSNPIPNWDYTREYQDMGTTQFMSVPYAFTAGSVIGLSNKIDIADTAAMLSPYARKADLNNLAINASGKTDTTALSNRINARVKYTDSLTLFVTPTQLLSIKGELVNLQVALDKKMNIADTSNMLAGYKQAINKLDADIKAKSGEIDTKLANYAKKNDLDSLAKKVEVDKKINDSNAAIDTKLKEYVKKSDLTGLATTTQLNEYVLRSQLDSAVSNKVNYSDTAAMLNSYARKINLDAAVADKVRYTDTANMLANYKSAISSLDAAKLNKADTAAMLSNYMKQANIDVAVADKVKYTDTALMLGNYAKQVNVIAGLNTKVNIADTANMLTNYAKQANVTAGLNTKVNIADTAAMLSNYVKQANIDVAVADKVKYTDTANMLANYKSAINSLDAAKLNKADTAAMLSEYAKQANVTAGLNTKVSIADTAAMLSEYAKQANVTAGLNTKVNIADTAAMLNDYARKINLDAVAADKVKYTDTASMLTNYAKQANVTAGLNTKVNIADTANMLSNYRTAINTNTVAVNGKLNSSDTAAMLASYRNTLNTVQVGKLNISDTANMLTSYRNAINGKQNTLVAGTGITISGNTISATTSGGNLNSLNDVVNTQPLDGQLLRFNATSTNNNIRNKWEPWTPNFLTANQTITLSGAVTGSGATSITTTLANNAVATANIADGAITTAKIATGAVVEADIADGAVTNAKIAANAAIADTKLATISTAGKVANSATTATSSNTASTIVARDASGNFSAGDITANSFVRSGGTAAQILAANGTVITAGTGISISGGNISANLTNTTDSSVYSTKAYRQKGVDSLSNLINTLTSVRLGSINTGSTNFTINNSNFSAIITASGVLNQNKTIISITSNGDFSVALPTHVSNDGKTIILRNMADNTNIAGITAPSGTTVSDFRTLGSGRRYVEYICVGSVWVQVNAY
ncbi:MAG: beta strand repeat-containing protein [Chitinophagaceae bacterium]